MEILLIGTKVNMRIKNNLCVPNTYWPLLLQLLNILNILYIHDVLAYINFILALLSLLTRPSLSALVLWLSFFVFFLPTASIYLLELTTTWLNYWLRSFACILRLEVPYHFSSGHLIILGSLDEAFAGELDVDALSPKLLRIDTCLLLNCSHHLEIVWRSATLIKKLLPLQPLCLILSWDGPNACNSSPTFGCFPLRLIIWLHYGDLIDLGNLKKHLLAIILLYLTLYTNVLFYLTLV